MVLNLVKAANKNSPVSEYRYERKFFIEDLTYFEVENLIRTNAAIFSEIFSIRRINNIYFDTSDIKNYQENVDGNTLRTKYRIRWYGEMFGQINKPVLEIKSKKGIVGNKTSYLLTAFEFKKGLDFDEIKNFILNSKLPLEVKDKIKTYYYAVFNSYERKYFQSSDKNFRITLDREQKFYNLKTHNNLFLNSAENNLDVIMELKYSVQKDPGANAIVNQFPFRLSKSSKYVNAVEKTGI